jgi:hypothetical protein
MIDNDDARPSRKHAGHGRFEDRLAFGDEHELRVGRWLEGKGYRVTRLSRGACDGHGGLKLHGMDSAATATDFLVVHARSGRTRMLGLRTKAKAIWHVRTRCWTTGITAAELYQYEQAEEQAGTPCSLGFLQLGAGDRYFPKAPPPPAGLFTARVSQLAKSANHTYGTDVALRIFWNVDCEPWRHCATLADLGLAP